MPVEGLDLSMWGQQIAYLLIRLRFSKESVNFTRLIWITIAFMRFYYGLDLLAERPSSARRVPPN